MYTLRNILFQSPVDGCCTPMQTRSRTTICICIFLVVLVQFCDSKNVVNQPRKYPPNQLQIMSDYPRRHVRLVIRNAPVEIKTDNILKRYVRERDRTLVRVIRTKRKKRNKNVLHISPTHMRTVRLKSKTGFFLEIQPSGKVSGHINKTRYTKMELQVITPHVKRIKSVATGRYLAINKKGKVISKAIADSETLLFEELMEDFCTTYSSLTYPKSHNRPQWYLGIYLYKKYKSKVRRASRTIVGDAATHFHTIPSFDTFLD